MRRPELPPLVLALLLALPSAAAAQNQINEVRPAAPGGAVRIQNLAGSVRVTGWDRDSIAVSGTVAGSGAPFVLHVVGANAKLGVFPDGDSAPTAKLEVRVPAGSRVWVKTSAADVIVRSVRGGVDVSTVSGRIEVRDQPAELYAESMGGEVLVEVETRLLRVRTAGSNITIRGRVADAEAYTVTGLVTILNKQVERGRFESVDGGIRYTGGIARTSAVEFATHGGDIDLALPSSLAADVRINSFQGTVQSELGKLARNSGSKQGNEYSLTLNGGGAEVIIRTFKGAVRLRPM
jgi:hypothetical protein